MKVVFFMMAIFAFVGCPQETPVETPVDPPVVDGGDSTQAGDSSTNGETTPDYSAKVSVESIELVSGGSTTFTVTSKDGTWLVFDEDLDADQISVVLKDGVCTVTSLKDADYNGAITLYESEERADDIVIPFTITYPYVDVKINFSKFTLTQDDVLTVHYGNAEDNTFEDIEATISEDGKSAIAKFKKDLANQWFWYNGITFSATVGEETIALRPTSDSTNNFDYTNTETWPNGVILTIEETPEGPEYMPIKIIVENIDNVATVEVTYGHNGADGEAGTEDDVSVTEIATLEENIAIVNLSSENVLASNPYVYISIVLKDSNGEEITWDQGNIPSWPKFTTEETEIKLSNVIAEFTDLCVNKELTLPGSGYTQILEASVFDGLTIKSLKVTLVNADGTWSDLSAANAWDAATYQLNCHNTTTYIDSSTFITALAINGLWIQSDSTSATVTVSYTE